MAKRRTKRGKRIIYKGALIGAFFVWFLFGYRYHYIYQFIFILLFMVFIHYKALCNKPLQVCKYIRYTTIIHRYTIDRHIDTI